MLRPSTVQHSSVKLQLHRCNYSHFRSTLRPLKFYTRLSDFSYSAVTTPATMQHYGPLTVQHSSVKLQLHNCNCSHFHTTLRPLSIRHSSVKLQQQYSKYSRFRTTLRPLTVQHSSVKLQLHNCSYSHFHATL